MSSSTSGSILETFFKTFEGKASSEKDVEEFGERLLTYIYGQKWVRRPLILSPAVCAQYGWKCINSNLLECVTCGAKLCTPDPNFDVYDVYKACIEKILQDLKASHKTHCPWPLTPSSASFLKMSVMPKEESLKHFIHRVSSSVTGPFPSIKDSVLPLLGLEGNHITSLCKLAGVSSENISTKGRSIAVLAATGWYLKCENEKENKAYVKCENCQRKIWIGAFNSTDESTSIPRSQCSSDANISNSTDTEAQVSEDSPPKRIKRFKKEDFDPVAEHRPWCLWVVSDDQKYKFDEKGDGPHTGKCDVIKPVPGWRIFLNSLLRNVTETQTSDVVENPSKEQIKSVKDLLDSWAEITGF